MKFFLIIIGFILSCNFSDRISFDEKVAYVHAEAAALSGLLEYYKVRLL